MPNISDHLEGILSGRIKSKPDPELDAIFEAVEKERAKMKANNGNLQGADDYTLIDAKK